MLNIRNNYIKQDDSSSKDGLSFWEVLGLIFITLKLTNTITWSWIWVLAPLWGSILFSLLLILVTFFKYRKNL